MKSAIFWFFFVFFALSILRSNSVSGRCAARRRLSKRVEFLEKLSNEELAPKSLGVL